MSCQAERLLVPKGWLFPKADKQGAIQAYEKAANMYKAVPNKLEAANMFEKAVEICSSIGDDQLFKMATLCESAASLLKDGVDKDRAAGLYDKAAFYYRQNGTDDGSREALSKAVQIQGLSPAILETTCNKLIQLAIDDEAPDAALVPSQVLQKHFASQREMQKGIDVTEQQISIKENAGRSTGLHTDVVTLCLFQLGAGDYVAATLAQRTYMRLKGFLESEECGLIDRLLAAYDEGDADVFKEAITCRTARTLPREVYAFAQTLCVPGGRSKMKIDKAGPLVDVADTTVSGGSVPQVENDGMESDNSDL